MPRETPSPIDLDAPPPSGGGVRWASLAIVTATLLLLVCNVTSLRDWVDDLAPRPAQARLAAAADAWASTTDELGLGAPRAWLHARWKRLEEARFGKP